MNKEELVAIVKQAAGESYGEFEDAFSKKMDDMSVKNARKVVEQMFIDRNVYDRDISGLDSDQKIAFANQIIAAYRGDHLKAIVTKANEALIEQQDNRGGYLVQPEVAAAIMRIAASVGTIMKQCQQWPMKSDQLGIPNYTGAFLTGAYIGVDLPGTVTGLTFGQAVLIAQRWQLAFTIGNDLMQDANVNVADWLLTLAGEALANMIDQQGFIGGTATTAPGPFVGILNVAGTNTYQMATGNTTYASFNPVTDAAAVVGKLEESVLDGAAWYMHRTVWAKVRAALASTSGLPFLYFGSLNGNQLVNTPGGGPIKPAGEMEGYPVFTNRWLPATTVASQANTPFLIFGNMKGCAFGDKGDMRIAQFQSGTFANKEVALADQTGIVYKHRHAFVVVLPAAFVVVSTSSS